MTRFFLLPLFAFLFGSPGKVPFKSFQDQTDSLFLEWNNATFLSLQKQVSDSVIGDSVRKELYKNRIAAFKNYLSIRTLRDVKPTSIRYKFLKMLPPHNNSIFYVIEANQSGAKVSLRNFVLYEGKKISNIEFYVYEGIWRKKGAVTLKNSFLQKEIKSYFEKKGFNDDDIVITKFRKNTVEASEYFLFGTLSKESGVKVILDSYKKGNFLF